MKVELNHNIYLIHGEETFLVDEAVKQIVNGTLSEEEMEFNYSQYDLREKSISAAIDDVNTLGFMAEKKVVLARNAIFLTAQRDTSKVKHNIELLEEYVKNPNPDAVLILVAEYEKLDKRKKLTKLLNKQACVIEAARFNEREAERWVSEKLQFNQVQFTNGAVSRLISFVGANLLVLGNEVDKILTYLNPGGYVTEEVIDELVAKTLEQNIFTLVEKITTRQINEAFIILSDLIRQNESPIGILALITGQFRIIFQSKILLQEGNQQGEIAKILKAHPYRVSIAMNQAKSYEEQEVQNILDQLAELDFQMKNGADQKLLLELFIASLDRNAA